MQKRIGQIAEAFEHLKFEEAAILAEQTLKKNAKQKKNQLEPTELAIIHAFQVGALNSLGRHHEARVIARELHQGDSLGLMAKENPFLLASVTEMFMAGEEGNVVQKMEQAHPGMQSSQVHRFYLSGRMFSALGKLFLKEFMNTKNPLFQLGQIYLDYLQQLDKFGQLTYKRDCLYPYHAQLAPALKLVNMFLTKCSAEAKKKIEELKPTVQGKPNEDKAMVTYKSYEKVSQRADELRMKIAIHEGKAEEAIKIFKELGGSLKWPMRALRSIHALGKVSADFIKTVDPFYFQQIGLMMRRNLDFATYTPSYDYYEQFKEWLLTGSKETVDHKGITLKQQRVTFQKLYVWTWNGNFADILSHYYNSLNSQYCFLTDSNHPSYATNTKADYYRIAIKGLLLQLISISHTLGHKQHNLHFLKQYAKHFSGTLTFPYDLPHCWNLLIKEDVVKREEEVKSQKALIQEINYLRISWAVQYSKPTIQSVESIFKTVRQLYEIKVKEVEKSRVLEKGERYLSDELVTAAVDHLRCYLDSHPHPFEAQQHWRLIHEITEYLEQTIIRSPFNADLKLRLMLLLGWSGHFEKLMQVFISNDIKSVQWQTVGYWMLSGLLEGGSETRFDDQLRRMVKSYQDNQRQTSQYGLKSLKAGELQRVDEFVSYRLNTQMSYNWLVLLLVLYRRHRLQHNSEYYLEQIYKELVKFVKKERELTLNADSIVLNNQLYLQNRHCNFYGVFNSPTVLQCEASIGLHLHRVVQSLKEEQPAQLVELQSLSSLIQKVSEVKVEELSDFSCFAFQQTPLKINQELNSTTSQQHRSQLACWKSLSLLRAHLGQLASRIVQLIKGGGQLGEGEAQQIKGSVLGQLKQLAHTFDQMSHRQQAKSITQIRVSLMQGHALLSMLRDWVAKPKKYKAIKAVIEVKTTPIQEQIWSCLLQLRCKQPPKSGLVSVQEREESLHRVLHWDEKEVKRMLGRYSNYFKP